MVWEEIEKKIYAHSKNLKGWFINKTAAWKSQYGRKDKASIPIPQATQHEISN